MTGSCGAKCQWNENDIPTDSQSGYKDDPTVDLRTGTERKIINNNLTPQMPINDPKQNVNTTLQKT